MSFDDLPLQPPINPDADRYAVECLKMSRMAAAASRCELDVRYGGDYWQKLDIYLPAMKGLRDLPVFLFLHGGGWTHGFKEWCGFMAPALVDLPAIFVSVSYRLLPAVAYPKPVEDGIAALKWIFDHIGGFGGSPRRLFIGGHSAGGHITALIALRRDWLVAAGLPADAVRACFCMSTTFNRRMVNADAAPDHVPTEPFFSVAPDSPLALADRAKIPFFIAWGGREHERLERTGRQMIDALQRAQCPVEWHVFPECDHFDIHLDTRHAGNLWTQRVRAWMSGSSSSGREQQIADVVGRAGPAW